ncbi:MAG: hypothetical protein SWZ49_14105, partial [Cyanobacteriota bacterium]|nr:hypothetical protein [Cyanobacteriota bacterium]
SGGGRGVSNSFKSVLPADLFGYKTPLPAHRFLRFCCEQKRKKRSHQRLKQGGIALGVVSFIGSNRF